MSEMPVDVLNHRLGKLRDNGDIDFDHAAVAVDIDEELQRKFIFIPREEIDAVKIINLHNHEDDPTYQAGSGPETIRANIGDNPNWLHNSAINALAMCQFLMREQDRKANEERLAKRPEPGLYRVRDVKSWFDVIVTADRRVLVPQQFSGNLHDCSDVWDRRGHSMWTMNRIDLTDGTVQS